MISVVIPLYNKEKQIKRIGGVEPISIDVKIVAAMNADPIECVKNKIIREDLFYRLSVVQIKVPPLRERQADLFFQNPKGSFAAFVQGWMSEERLQ